MKHVHVLVLVLGLALGLVGCSGREAEVSSIGRFHFGDNRTTLADAREGHCEPTDVNGRKVTWCYELTPYKVAHRTAEVDAYFLGTEPTAPLIELQFKVRGCVENDVETWMRSLLGNPVETLATRTDWQNSFLFAAAYLPLEPGRCLIRFLPTSEQADIARIKAK